jgi:signal transduction histidine kinase
MTLTRQTRPLLIVLIWLSFSLLQAGSLAAGSGSWDRLGALLSLHGCIGLAWAGLTLAIGAWMAPADEDGTARRLGRHVLALLICGLVDTLVRRVVATAIGSTMVIPWYGTLLFFADRTFVQYVAIVLITRTFAAHDRFVARRQQSLALQAELARAKLASLEERLHPHFLFNCLGAVSELAHEAPSAAARMLRQLASVLRFAVERDGSEVTVAEEFAALEPYLDVQRTRFSDWLRIETRVAPDTAHLLMPPLVLQPLVENAIRHGLVRRDSPGAILLSAATRGDRLILEVRDNGIGLRGSQMSGRGLGTMNLRDRLTTLYGDAGVLSLYEDATGGVISEVSIPAHVRPDKDEELIATTSERPGRLAEAFRRWPIAAITLAWAVWGLLYTQQSIAYLAFRGRLAGRSPVELAAQDFMLSMLWAALTPLMLLMARWVPLQGRRVPLRIGAHAVAAISIAALHGWASQQLLPVAGAPLSPEWIAATSWGILAYAVVLTAAHYGRIQSWLEERELADATMRAHLAESELEATYLRARPQQLLDRLEAIAESIQRDASSAEGALARLGDQLRASLEEKVPA